MAKRLSQEKEAEKEEAFQPGTLDKDQEQQKLELEMQKRRERIEKVDGKIEALFI